ncbi:hypothetical protein D0T50_11750 [Bacteroides sp. 214]|uniref:hypothetical protein n=1 Tax=Bacteroides sp. 214 TaxID=2302935 RepID=UPI0013D7C96A|nr:hypothetical protein [Bacteroides sp. 214]NDW13558.1 hypothetical protein [Bacteroides sp. 214]
MKANKILSYAAAVILLANLGACSREEIEVNQPPHAETGKTVTVKARLNQTNDTRLSHQYIDKVIKAAWTKDHATQRDDALMVFGMFDEGATISTGQIFDITDIQAGVATFTGNMPAGEMYMFVYPAHRILTDPQQGMFNLLGQTQTGNDNLDHIAEYTYMLARATDLTQELQFEHATAVLRINVKHPTEALGYKPVSITLNNADGENFAIGMGSANDDYDEVFVKGVTIALKDMEAVTAGATSTIYAVIFPNSIDESLNVNVQYAHETNPRITATGTIAVATGGQAIEEGYVYNIPQATLTAIAANNIFSDATVSDGVAPNFSGGDGLTEDTPFLISNAADLKKLVEVFSAYNADYNYYLLTTDIHVTATHWEPISRKGFFHGTFDGGGHTISGVLNDAGNPDYPYFGFFGFLYNECTIKNLHVAANIVSEGGAIGGIIGGISIGSTALISIENCTMTGSIAVEGKGGSIGGIIGNAYGSDGKIATIAHCTMTGNITATTTGENSQVKTGGIAGNTSGAATTHCTASGEITVSSESQTYVGGITGNAFNSTVSHCRNYSNITVTKADGIAYIGGITGDGTPTYCFNAGNITAANLNNTSGHSNVIGGITGTSPNVVTDCINEGNLKVSASTNETHIGGVAGVLDGYTKTGMANCRNRGAVEAKNMKTVMIGGLVGTHYHEKIHNSHNESTRLVETNNTSVQKGTLIGYRFVGAGAYIYDCCTSVEVTGWGLVDDDFFLPTCTDSH